MTNLSASFRLFILPSYDRTSSNLKRAIAPHRYIIPSQGRDRAIFARTTTVFAQATPIFALRSTFPSDRDHSFCPGDHGFRPGDPNFCAAKHFP
jgi:hypothetical protein